MPKRKAQELGDGLEAPRRSSRRISTANGPPESSKPERKPPPTPKKSKKTEKSSQDEKKGVNDKEEEDEGPVSPSISSSLLQVFSQLQVGACHVNFTFHLVGFHYSSINTNCRNPRKLLKLPSPCPSPPLLTLLHPAANTGS